MARLLGCRSPNGLETLICGDEIPGYPDLEQLGHVTGAKLAQVRDLLNLALDIQK